MEYVGRLFRKPNLYAERDAALKVAIGLMEREGYKNVKPLGRGVVGDVVAAKCPDTEKTVAVKIIALENTWAYEKSLWPTFQHSNILPLLKTTTVERYDFYAMPMHQNSMEGMLEKYSFKRHVSAVRQCLKWTQDVMNGLSYLHHRGISHLDVKLDNVLISSDMSAILCDFSCVNTTKRPVFRYGLWPKYRPPECWYLPGEKHPAVFGLPFDTWCVGILLLSALTGQWMEKKIKEYKTWETDVLPCMRKALEPRKFRSLIKRTFPKSASAEKNLVPFIRNFLHCTLTKNPENRPLVSTLLHHRIFKHSGGILFVPDKMWIQEVPEDIKQNDETIKEAFDDKNTFVEKDNISEEKKALVSSEEGSMDQGECSSKTEEHIEENYESIKDSADDKNELVYKDNIYEEKKDFISSEEESMDQAQSSNETEEDTEKQDDSIKEAGGHKKVLVGEDSNTDEKEFSVSNDQGSMDPAECSYETEEKQMDDETDQFEAFVRERALMTSRPDANPLMIKIYAADRDHQAGENWIACFEAGAENDDDTIPEEENSTEKTDIPFIDEHSNMETRVAEWDNVAPFTSADSVEADLSPVCRAEQNIETVVEPLDDAEFSTFGDRVREEDLSTYDPNIHGECSCRIDEVPELPKKKKKSTIAKRIKHWFLKKMGKQKDLD